MSHLCNFYIEIWACIHKELVLFLKFFLELLFFLE